MSRVKQSIFCLGKCGMDGFGRRLFVAALLLCAAGVPASVDPPRGSLHGAVTSVHPDWFKQSFLDIEEDIAEAAEAGKHVMLYMYTNGCPYCHKMIEENLKHAPYTEFVKANFDVIALNILGDREIAFNEQVSLTEKALANKLRVRYTPTIVFLDQQNKMVARINGYRSVEDFKHVLDYVQQQAYRSTSLADYIDQAKANVYALRAHPQLLKVKDLKSLTDRPLALLVEDQGCGDCATLHDGHLSDPAVNRLLQGFNFVRLDAQSTESIVDPDGNTTTPRDYVRALGLTYRPGLVLFDRGKEIARIESLLYRFHFSELLRYVGERHYEQYPNSFFDYLNVRTAELLDAGQDVNVGE